MSDDDKPPWADDNAIPAEEYRRGWEALAEWNRLIRERHQRDEAAGKTSKGQRQAKKRS